MFSLRKNIGKTLLSKTGVRGFAIVNSREAVRAHMIPDQTRFDDGPKPWLNPYFPSNESLLPVQLEHVPRRYPFTLTLTTVTNMWDIKKLKSDPPQYKSVLEVELRDMCLTEYEREVFLRICETRHNVKDDTVKFVSRDMPTERANNNRVLQMFDAAWYHARLLGAEFEAENKMTQRLLWENENPDGTDEDYAKYEAEQEEIKRKEKAGERWW